jgi:hypothetical protein
MTARDVDFLGRRLRLLQEQAFGRLAVAALAFGGALAASELRKDLAIPLLVAGIALAFLGLAAFVRRDCLLDEVASDRDAFALPAVRRYGVRLTTMERRRDDAASIRLLLRSRELATAERIEANRAALEYLARELERDELVFDPVCAVKLEHLLLRPEESALFRAELPASDLNSALVQIAAGLRP